MELLLATTNSGKAREFALLLSGCCTDLQLHTLDELAVANEVQENGQTFRANARIKALHVSCLTGMLTVADDSGLVVRALNGAPGVHSARYAGNTATDGANVDKLLCAMAGIADRRARFVTCLCLALAGDVVAEFRGQVAGVILDHPVGAGGFGYDPVFFYPPLAKSFAELSATEKNRVSHRAMAARRLRDFFMVYPSVSIMTENKV